MADDERNPRSCHCDKEETFNELCFVEGTNYEKEVIFDEHDMSDTVWKRTRPDVDFNETFGNSRPFVSARKLDITRAVLNGKFQTGKSTLRVKKK